MSDDAYILPQQKYSTNDVVLCQGCGNRYRIRHLHILDGGECRCPNCGGDGFQFSLKHPVQRIRQQCMTDYSPRKDPWAGEAEFRVVLKDRKVMMFAAGQYEPVATTTAKTYEEIYDKVAKFLKG